MAIKVIKKTTIKWKDTLLGIKVGETLEMESPLGIPASLASSASRMKTSGIAAFNISTKDGVLLVKRIA